MSKKLIVFDLDGTLADSSSCIVAAAQSTKNNLGLKAILDDTVRSMIGRPLSNMLADLFAIEGDILVRAVQEYSSEYVRLAETEERLFEGSISILSTLREAGFLLAIATGKSQHGAENATHRLGLKPYFDSIHGIIPGTPGKPHPAILTRVLQELDVAPKDCIMVGDTTFDLDLAHALNVRTVAVSWGVHSSEKLISRNPSRFVTNFTQLEQWLCAQG